MQVELLARWQVLNNEDRDINKHDQFILDSEETISIENSSWMAELMKSDKEKNAKASS